MTFVIYLSIDIAYIYIITKNRKTMNENLILLSSIADSLSLDVFYSISIREYEIRLQGKFDSKLTMKLTDLFSCKFEISSSGYCVASFVYTLDCGDNQISQNIDITLT